MFPSRHELFLQLLPPDWEVVPAAELGEVVSGGTPSRDVPAFWNGEISWVTPSEITQLRGKLLRSTAERISNKGLRASAARLLPAGSLLVTSRATLGAVAVTAIPVSTNQGFKSIVPNGAADVDFYFHVFNLAASEIQRLASGSTFQEISRRDFVAIRLPRPEREEQRRIAQILDAVDAAIQETEALIAKLKLIKAGLLHDLLTRGIDENGELRDPAANPGHFSESALGTLPAEWVTEQLGASLEGIDAGKSPDCPDTPAPVGEWGILKVSAVHPDGFKPQENKVVVDPADINAALEVRDGDLLISRANTYELVGLACFVRNPPPRLMLCDKTLRLTPEPRLFVARFLFYILQAPFVRRQIRVHATGTSGSMKNISQKATRRLLVVRPHLDEQRTIASVLDEHDERICVEEAWLTKLRQVKEGLAVDLLAGHVRVNVAGEVQP